jgi:DNA-binding NarL/FixJ family response regulator
MKGRRRNDGGAVDSLGTDPVPIGMLLVADDGDLLAAISTLVDLDERFRLTGTVADVDGAARAAGTGWPEVVVVDLDIADGGADLVRELRLRAPGVKLVAISSFPDPLTLFGVLARGGDAYLDRATAWTDLLPTVCELCGLPGSRHPADA